MNVILQLSKRHLLMFFRNKADVFFSFLSVLIVLGLYVFFLQDMTVANVKSIIGQDVVGVDALIHAWLFAGLSAISTMTLSIGLLSRMVSDKEKKVFNDFLVAPIKRHELFLSYILSTFIVVVCISLFTLVLGQIVIVISDGSWFSFIQWIRIVGVLLLVSISSIMMMLFIISFINTESVLSFLSTIVGTLIGFVIGAYIPIGVMPSAVAIFSNLLPIAHGAALLRQVLMQPSIDVVFANAPVVALEQYNKFQGVELYLNDTKITGNIMIIYLIMSTIIFMALNVWRFKKMKI